MLYWQDHFIAALHPPEHLAAGGGGPADRAAAGHLARLHPRRSHDGAPHRGCRGRGWGPPCHTQHSSHQWAHFSHCHLHNRWDCTKMEMLFRHRQTGNILAIETKSPPTPTMVHKCGPSCLVRAGKTKQFVRLDLELEVVVCIQPGQAARQPFA